ncbi:MAG TPA: Crp/Fnr family transcriptional regulator, partial [Ktedonobacterales bacterium]|nr:Crp/Fnr family transcriptional regulator [Ktedonobacterales bacterium]
MRALTAGEKQKLFEGHAFFGVLAPDDVDALLLHARSVRYSAGCIIFARGSPGRSMMAVLSGSVRISTTSPQGREVVLAILQAGEIFGEMALLDGGERAADAIAMSDCELLVVDQRDFIPFLKNRSDLCIALLRLLSRRLRRTDELVEAAMFERLESRLAKALIQLASADGAGDAAPSRVQLEVSQHHLSLMVGASREKVNRQLGAWQRVGLLELGKRRVMILDLEALKDCI